MLLIPTATEIPDPKDTVQHVVQADLDTVTVSGSPLATVTARQVAKGLAGIRSAIIQIDAYEPDGTSLSGSVTMQLSGDLVVADLGVFLTDKVGLFGPTGIVPTVVGNTATFSVPYFSSVAVGNVNKFPFYESLPDDDRGNEGVE
jgi:hypothetical protein